MSKYHLLVVRHELDQIKASEVKNKHLVGSNIDFKFSFKRPINEFTTSKNTLSLIYGKQSILVDFGEPITYTEKERKE
jgi:hypothetical protein